MLRARGRRRAARSTRPKRRIGQIHPPDKPAGLVRTSNRAIGSGCRPRNAFPCERAASRCQGAAFIRSTALCCRAASVESTGPAQRSPYASRVLRSPAYADFGLPGQVRVVRVARQRRVERAESAHVRALERRPVAAAVAGFARIAQDPVRD